MQQASILSGDKFDAAQFLVRDQVIEQLTGKESITTEKLIGKMSNSSEAEVKEIETLLVSRYLNLEPITSLSLRKNQF